ncbi:MAG: flagellar protein FliS [Pseudohongiellaceae bacterium]|jgi:flagellar protein FliS
MSLSAKSIDLNTQPVDEITPYRIITLLLDGALERVDQAIISLDEGDFNEASVLVDKTIGIVAGLRESLDTKQGGELANNLDLLYEYIVGQLQVIDDYDEPVIILDEVRKLLNEVHLGWVEIESQV